MQFKHRLNEKIIAADGRTFFNSRSVAVSTVFAVFMNGTYYVLLIKRGEDAPDFKGFFANVTGYLDWDETLSDAVVRELYEEVKINVAELLESSELIVGSLSTPYYVESNPMAAHQNVSIRYVFCFKVNELPTPIVDGSECSEAKWFNLYDLVNQINSGEITLAFNHNDIIVEFYNKKIKLNWFKRTIKFFKIDLWKFIFKR